MATLRIAVPLYARQYFNITEIKRQLKSNTSVQHYRLQAKSLFRRIKSMPLAPEVIHQTVQKFFDDLDEQQKAGLADGEKVLVPTLATQVAGELTQSIPTASGRDYQALYHELLRKQDEIIAQLLGQPIPSPAPTLPEQKIVHLSGPQGLPVARPAAPQLSELIDLRMRMLKATGKAEKTILAAGTAYKQFKRMLVDKPVDQYTAQEFMGLYEQFQTWLAPRTAHQRMITMSTLMNFAVSQKLIKESPCPVIAKPKEVKRSQGWAPYHTEDFSKLRQSPWFEDTAPKDYRGWIPMISRYSGLRLEEVGQLRTEDLQEHDGVLCFSVNDEGDKRVKSDSSIRLVPVHKHLIELGVQDIGNGDRLFPELRDTRGRGVSHAYSKTYGKHARKYVTEDRSKVFHSIRKLFAVSLANAEVHREVIGELLGHIAAEQITALYTGKVNVQRLSEAVDKIPIEI